MLSLCIGRLCSLAIRPACTFRATSLPHRLRENATRPTGISKPSESTPTVGKVAASQSGAQRGVAFFSGQQGRGTGFCGVLRGFARVCWVYLSGYGLGLFVVLVFAYGVGLSLFCFWFVCVAVLLVAPWRWPFLVFMSVYWYCPCAGRHSLSLRPQRK
jgi:hypothetical protein